MNRSITNKSIGFILILRNTIKPPHGYFYGLEHEEKLFTNVNTDRCLFGYTTHKQHCFTKEKSIIEMTELTLCKFEIRGFHILRVTNGYEIVFFRYQTIISSLSGIDKVKLILLVYEVYLPYLRRFNVGLPQAI